MHRAGGVGAPKTQVLQRAIPPLSGHRNWEYGSPFSEYSEAIVRRFLVLLLPLLGSPQHSWAQADVIDGPRTLTWANGGHFSGSFSQRAAERPWNDALRERSEYFGQLD